MSTLLQDLFTDADSTLLTSHAMNVGPGWTFLEGGGTQPIIVSNRAFDNADSPGHDYSDAGTGNTDYTASADFIFSTGFGTGDNLGLSFRITDSSNYWMAVINPSDNLFHIYEKTSGSGFVSQASVAFTPSANVTYTIQIVVSGTSVTATVNGGSSINYGSMATGLTSTKVGIRLSSNDSVAMLADNFLVTSAAVGATVAERPLLAGGKTAFLLGNQALQAPL